MVPASASTSIGSGSCFIFPKFLKAYTGKPKRLIFHSTGGEADFKAATERARLMNASQMVVITPEGEKTVLVYSDYLWPHAYHPGSLPAGWKMLRFIHRGEAEIKDGFTLRGNETSGSAHEKGEHLSNKVENWMTYLEGSPLANETTQFDAYDKAKEHYYPGFDEPDGTPKGLHKKRDAFINAFDRINSVLASEMYEIPLGGERDAPVVLAHWDIMLQGLTKSERDAVAPYRAGLEKAAAGNLLNAADAGPMLSAAKLLNAKRRRVYIVEVN